jgi:lysophospholipase L1-like esterase
MIENGFPADRVIDFRSGVGAEDFSDGIHLSAAGHERRARAAAATLSAAAPVAVP